MRGLSLNDSGRLPMQRVATCLNTGCLHAVQRSRTMLSDQCSFCGCSRHNTRHTACEKIGSRPPALMTEYKPQGHQHPILLHRLCT
jgi:hypothetical protein